MNDHASALFSRVSAEVETDHEKAIQERSADLAYELTNYDWWDTPPYELTLSCGCAYRRWKEKDEYSRQVWVGEFTEECDTHREEQ